MNGRAYKCFQDENCSINGFTFSLKIILNALFMTFFAFVVFPLITNGSEPHSAMLAIIPSAIAALILWFTLINKYVN